MIAEGLGGLGQSAVSWMVSRGARHLILLSRSPGRKDSRAFLQRMRAEGVNVEAPVCDIANLGQLQQTL